MPEGAFGDRPWESFWALRAPGNPWACTARGICLPAHTGASSQGMKTGHLGNFWQCRQGFLDLQRSERLIEVWAILSPPQIEWYHKWAVHVRKQTWPSCDILIQIPELPSHFHDFPMPPSPDQLVRKVCPSSLRLFFVPVRACANDIHLTTVPGKNEACWASCASITSEHSYGTCFPVLLHWLPYFK